MVEICEIFDAISIQVRKTIFFFLSRSNRNTMKILVNTNFVNQIDMIVGMNTKSEKFIINGIKIVRIAWIDLKSFGDGVLFEDIENHLTSEILFFDFLWQRHYQKF